MAKNYVYNDKFEVVEVYDNVFEALGYSPEEAKKMIKEADAKLVKRKKETKDQ